MNSSILIASSPTDLHAHVVAEALRMKGAQAIVWCVSDLPRLSGETVRFRGGAYAVEIDSPSLRYRNERFGTVWHRRIQAAPNAEILHPGDRGYAARQCDVFRQGILDLLCPEAFWVNPARSSFLASQKIFQQHAANKAGFSTPETIVSNDPAQIKAFIREMGGRVIFKSLTPVSWTDEIERCWAPFTTEIGESDLVNEELLRQTPAIFQERVEKAFEVRLTLMGRSAFAAKLRSQETQKGRTDWRLAYDELAMEPLEVPQRVKQDCIRLMERLGLVFGCFDFIVTPGGAWIFLEVNEMGQFLFVESYAGLPLLDAFSDFLIAGRADFEWTEHEAEVRFADLHEPVRRAMVENAKNHVHVESPTYHEGPKQPRERSSV